MEEISWKVFETTGSVVDYLQYKQEYYDGMQRNEADEQYKSEGNDSTGYGSSKCAPGGL
ncbi:MAG: hypothetical protein HFI75_11515 [Lachnospiraceae bacterium]|nr:hypothetical protein [Lachnospiraceae bacterium]